MKKNIFSMFALGLLLLAGAAQAAELVYPASKDDPNVVVGSAETHRNLYAVGGNVTVNGNTLGDLVAAGGIVTLVGNVEQEALIAGGSLNINGSVGSHARIAGGNITISGPVGGDLAVAGGNVNLTGKTSVNGDLLLAGGNAVIDAPVKGMARIAGGNITINSKIGGNVYVQSTQRLTFGSQADIGGQVYYKGPQQAIVQNGAKVGNIQFTQLARREEYAKAIFTVVFFVKLLAWILTALVLSWLFKGFAMRLGEDTFSRPWENLGIGLVILIVTPIVAILLLVTVVGYYLALLLGVVYALFLALTAIYAAINTGFLILKYLVKRSEIMYWQAVIIGVVVWYLLRLIPIVGWVVMAIIFLMTLGALVRMGRQRFLSKGEAQDQ